MIIQNDGWLREAEHCVSPNCNDRPQGEVSLLIIHNISLPPGRFGGPWIRDFFRNRLDPAAHPYFATITDLQVSAHLLIERTGTLVQFVSFDRRAWHAGVSSWEGRAQCNDYSIGIELEGADDQPFTDLQYDRLAAVTRVLQQRYPAITRARIVGHSDVAPGRKTDPGPCFDWPRYRGALEP